MQVEKTGLYYRFSCRCHIPTAGICRVKGYWQDRDLELGVLIPSEGQFCLNTKVAAKKCGEGRPEFRVYSRKNREGIFVPLSPEEPFAYIARLKDAFFERRYGNPGLVLQDRGIPGEGIKD